MAHHVVQYAAALQVSAPEPRLVRPAVLLGRSCQIGPACGGNASCPDDLAPCRDGWSEELIFKIPVPKTGLFNQFKDAPCLANIPREWLLARDAFERSTPALECRCNFLDILHARVIWSAKPYGVDGRIGNHIADRFVEPGFTHVEGARETRRF